MQTPPSNVRNDVLALVLNGIVTTRKNDRDRISEAKNNVGTDHDYMIDEMIHVVGTCCIGGDKAATPVKARPDWRAVCMFLLNKADTPTKRKASKMLNDTKYGEKVDIDALNLSQYALDTIEKMNEIVDHRHSSPTVNVRCGWSVVENLVPAEDVATKTVTVDVATGEVNS
tara:strand:+ start:2384 stop:2896 length:513 start_codon:yes stop_codon:yes gene_type:complete